MGVLKKIKIKNKFFAASVLTFIAFAVTGSGLLAYLDLNPNDKNQHINKSGFQKDGLAKFPNEQSGNDLRFNRGINLEVGTDSAFYQEYGDDPYVNNQWWGTINGKKYLKFIGDKLGLNQEERENVKQMITDVGDTYDSKDPYVIVPDIYYLLWGEDNSNIKEITYEGKYSYDKDYALANVISMDVQPDSTKKDEVLLLVNYLKETRWGLDWALNTLTEADALGQFKSYPTDPYCFRYYDMATSPNLWQKWMGYIRTTLNCGPSIFNDFSLGDYFTKFLGIGDREVTVLQPDQEYYDPDAEYVTLDQAKLLTDREDVNYGDKLVLPSTLKSWGKDFSINKLVQLEDIKSRFQKLDSREIIDELIAGGLSPTERKSSSYLSFLSSVLFSMFDKEILKADFPLESGLNGNNLLQLLTSSLSDLFGEQFNKLFFNNNDFLNYLLKNSKVRLISKLTKEMGTNDLKLQSYIDAKKPLETRVREITAELENIQTYFDNNADVEAVFATYNEYQDELAWCRASIEALNTDIFNAETLKQIYEKSSSPDASQKLSDIEASLNSYRNALQLKQNEEQEILTRIQDLTTTYKIYEYQNKVEDKEQLLREKRAKMTKIEEWDELGHNLQANTNYLVQVQQLLENVQNVNDVGQLFRNQTLSVRLKTFKMLFEETLFTIFNDLGLAKEANGEYQYDFSDLLNGEEDAVKALFTKKQTVANLNKIIDFFNTLNDNDVSSENLFSIAKLLKLAIPKGFYDFLNTEFSFAGNKVTPKNGINLRSVDIYGKIVGGWTAGTGAAGSIIGSIIGKAKQTKKRGTLFGAIVGGIVGAIVGGGISAGVTNSWYADGELQITKIDDDLLHLLDYFVQNKEEQEEFDLLLDGYNLIKTTSNESITRIFGDITHLFLDKHIKIQELMNNLDKLDASGKTKARDIVANVFKNFILSPVLWDKLFHGKNFDDIGWDVVLQEDVMQIMEEVKLDRTEWKNIVKNDNSEYLDQILALQNEVIRILWFSAFSQTSPDLSMTEFENDNTPVKIGFYSSIMPRIKVETLESNVHNYTNMTTDFEFIDLDTTPNEKVDVILSIHWYNEEDKEFINLDRIEQRQLQRDGAIHNIPLFKSDLVVITNTKYTGTTNLTYEDIKSWE